MKRLILSLFLLTGLGVEAQQFKISSFLPGWHVVISNNVTVLYGATNIPFADAANTNLEYSLTNTYYLAYQGAGYPYWTNTIITNTSVPAFPLAWQDVPTWSDRNGNIPTGLAFSATITGDDANATNLVTFVLQGVAYQGNAGGLLNPTFGLQSPVEGNSPRAYQSLSYPETATADTLTFTMNGNGATPVTLRTNLPSTFLGSGAIRIKSIQTSNSYTNTYLQAVTLSGFQP